MKFLIPALIGLSLAQGQTVLFSDTFDRPDSRHIDATLGGITDATGSNLVAGGVYSLPYVDPNNAAPIFGAQDADSTNGGGTRILGNALQLAVGAGTSNAAIRHNFINPEILTAGGFSVSLDVVGFANTSFEFGGAFAIGMSENEAASAGDALSGAARMTGAFGQAIGAAVPAAVVSDFWIALRGNNSLAWGSGTGLVQGSTNLGVKTGTVRIEFAVEDFNAGSTVGYEVFLNDVSRGSGTFTWSGTDENLIALDARDGTAVSFDNLVIATLPAPRPTASLEALPKQVPGDDPAAAVTLSWSGERLPAGTTYEITATPSAVFPNDDASGDASAGSGTVDVVVDGTAGDTEFGLRFLNGGSEIAAATFTVRRQRTNVLLILLDDMGFSDWGCYGSEIRTPTIDSLGATGLRYRNFYNTARCSTTRCALLSGLYTQQVAANPGASLPDLREDNNVSIPELLSTTGYRSYMAGKWHTGTSDTRSPIGRGFPNVFGHRGGGNYPHNLVDGSNHDSFWKESNFGFYSENNEIPAIDYSGTQFHQTTAIGDYAVRFIDHHVSKNDGAPFFLYLPFNAQHWPINAPAEMADRYTDSGDFTPDGLTADDGSDGGDYFHYEVGWDAVRAGRLAKQKALGVLPAATTLSPRSPAINSDGTDSPDPSIVVDIPAWDTLSSDRQGDLARRMAVYAAMLEMIDDNIKKVVDHLAETGLLDDTLIFVLADNGGNYEGGLYGRTRGVINAAPLTTTADLASMGQPDHPDLRLGGGWANVNNTPFRLFKHYQHEGGIRTPCIIHWTNGISSPGRWIDDRGHLIDIMATISEVTETPWPGTWPGRTLLPWEGESLVPHFKPETVADFPERSIGFEHESNRAWFKGKYKFVTKHFSYPDGSSPQNELELYDLSVDPTELNNLAPTKPVLLAEMIDEWNAWAQHVGVPAARLIAPPVPQLDPAPLAGDLFVDTFNRADDGDPDASATGMSGAFVPPLGVGAAYYDSWEEGSTEVSGSNLLMANGSGMTEAALRHNFVDPEILAAGGFSMQVRIDEINSTGGDEANRYAGLALGLSAGEAQSSNDIGQAGPPTSFRGTPGSVAGTADAFIELDQNGNVKCWIGGAVVETIPVGSLRGTLLVSCETASFAAGGGATLRAWFDGRPLDLDSASSAITRSFTWSRTDQNYLGLSARASGYVKLDNFAVRLLPLSATLASEYAMAAGLSGSDTAPEADPDGDGDDNFVEWLKAGSPDGSDAGTRLLSVAPSADGVFRFSYAHLNDAEAAGLTYTFHYSADLSGEISTWPEFTPQPVSSQPLGDRHEVRLVSLPDELAAGNAQLFIVVEVK
ncbi:sulfatase-like hydrolase/transferase [Haloferula sargassicola]|uniref:Sulfatase N-terminal domain-containing protein n=1 Tax=Haloferula sargassicola TaxID=490096 RepID=A0ABP9UUT6_9BACT